MWKPGKTSGREREVGRCGELVWRFEKTGFVPETGAAGTEEALLQ